MRYPLAVFLKQYGPLLAHNDQHDKFWGHARNTLKKPEFDELLHIFYLQGIEVIHGERNQKILYEVRKGLQNPWVIPQGSIHASDFINGVHKCADHLDEVCNACLLNPNLDVYEFVDKETGELDYIIMHNMLKLDNYIRVCNEEGFYNYELNTSMFKQILKPI